MAAAKWISNVIESFFFEKMERELVFDARVFLEFLLLRSQEDRGKCVAGANYECSIKNTTCLSAMVLLIVVSVSHVELTTSN